MAGIEKVIDGAAAFVNDKLLPEPEGYVRRDGQATLTTDAVVRSVSSPPISASPATLPKVLTTIPIAS
jgi:hypothetical protein